MKVVIASLLIAAVFAAQIPTPLKSNVLQVQQAHDKASPITVKKQEKILLQTIHNGYVRANPSKNVNTQMQPGGVSLEWTLETLSNGMVAFKSTYGTYLRCLPGVNDICDLVSSRLSSAQFEIVRNTDDTTSFKTIDNAYLRAWPGESARVDTNPWIGVWERFRIISTGPISAKLNKEKKMQIRTIHNTYVKPDDSADHAKVNCQTALSPRTEWRVQYYNNGRVALKSAIGGYISALPGVNSVVELRTLKVPQAWETYDVVENGDGTVSFKTAHGSFLRAWPGENGKVDTNPFIGIWERFRLVPSE